MSNNFSDSSRKKQSLSDEQKRKLTDLFQNCTLGVLVTDEVPHDKQVAHASRIAKSSID